MSAEDWHGWCFHEGMAGNCGLSCRVFATECTIQDEVVENCTPEEIYDEGHEEYLIDNYEQYMDYFVKNLEHYMGSLRYNILKIQTKFKFDEEEEVRKLFK